MMKKTLSIVLVLATLLSVLALNAFSVSAETENDVHLATADEATKDQASIDEVKLVITDEPDVDISTIEGTVIGIIGDTNKDGRVNIKDSTNIQKYLAKLVYMGESGKLLGNVDGNEKLNVRDATTIQKFIAGLNVDTKILHILYQTGEHTHNFVESVFEATCTKDGYTAFSCICGEEKTENVVNAFGHDYSMKVTSPNCVEGGFTEYTCKTCKHSYKDKFTNATGVHRFEKGVCKDCNFRESTPYILAVKDYVIKNGTYDKESKAYLYELKDTYTDYDAAFLTCQKDVDAVVLSYAVYFEDGIDIISIGIMPEEEDFGFYMICGGYFECAGSYNIGKYTQNVKNIPDAEYYFYADGITEAEALEYTLDYVDRAINTYARNQELPATFRELGFRIF
ncbi:MAG: dockerin type I repeat-containing protein [Clostridia bacterium]|nr:dockerin type I repeat-containing protein [Clostridia bacterium]